MKKSIIISILLLGMTLFSHAAGVDSISVSIFKSTFIYFDAPVVQTDLGMDVAYDVAFENNYVKITAVQQRADYQTNLTVVTKAGIYAFLVDYKKNPEKLYFFPEDYTALRRFDEMGTRNKPTVSSLKVADTYNPQATQKSIETMQEYSEQLYETKMKYPITGYSKAKMNFYMDKIYVKDDMFFIKLNLKNDSNIDFDVDFVKFHIRNKKKIKRSSKQEIYMEPIYSYNNVKKVVSNTSEYMVFVIDKFTIMNDKQFYVQFEEASGERNVEFQVMNKDIISAVQF